MDGSEDTTVMRAMWQQMGDLSRTLNARIDETNTRIDETNARLDRISASINGRIDDLSSRMNDNFARVQRNFENVQHNIGTMLHDFENRLLAVLARREDRVDELDARLTRVEKHLGLP